MRLGEKILAKLEENHGSVPYILEVKECGLNIRAEITDLDRLGCIIQQITIQKKNGKDLCSLDEINRDLETIASLITQKITYLLENIAMIEWDKNAAYMILRSNPPERSPDKISYYEIVLSQGNYLSLNRYRYEREKISRVPQPIDLTREVFVRLIEDLAFVLNPPA
jgi:hypothetical protein